MGPPKILKKTSNSAFRVLRRPGTVSLSKLKRVQLRIPRKKISQSQAAVDCLDDGSKKVTVVTEMEEIATKNDPLGSFEQLPLSGDDGMKIAVFANGVIPFCGFVTIAVLKGEIHVNGCMLNSTSPPFAVVSCSLAGLSTMECSALPAAVTRTAIVNFRDFLKGCGISRKKQYLKNFRQYTTVCVIEKQSFEDVESLYLLSRPTFKQILPSKPEFFSPKECTASFVSSAYWDTPIEDVSQLVKDNDYSVCVTGPKDVGKSTFCRFLINTLLERFSKVFFLECDAGQTEFTPSGIISLCSVESPLLGLAPFTHQQRPLNATFFGDVTPKDNPTKYLACIRQIFETYSAKHRSQGPLVINTHGWMRGLGGLLLADTIKLVQPSAVVQLTSSLALHQKNSTVLSCDMIAQSPGFRLTTGTNDRMHQSACEDIEFMQINTCEDRVHRGDKGAPSASFTAIEQRSATLLAYLGGLYRPDVSMLDNKSNWIPRPLTSIVPYEFQWSDVALHVAHCKVDFAHCLLSFNASLVSLSRSEECKDHITADKKILLLNRFPSDAVHLGFGIVRNIDVERRLFFILTPEPLSVCGRTNLLVKGNIEVPRALITENANVMEGESPYCSPANAMPSVRGSGARKPRFNLLRRSLESSSSA